MDKLICTECGDACRLVEETFSYAGTHCTGGNSGIRRTGYYSSDCCNSDTQDAGEYRAAQECAEYQRYLESDEE